MKQEQAESRARILKAMAHPTRILMVEALSRGDRSVNQLRSLADVSQPTITAHLEKLKKAGIVTEHREGRRVIHHLACPCMLEAVECTLGVIRSLKQRQNQVS